MSRALAALARGLQGLRARTVNALFVALLGLGGPAWAQQADERVENRATVTYTDANGHAGMAEGSATIWVSRQGSITLRKRVDRPVAAIGDTLEYTLRWTNSGVGVASAFTLTDSLPDFLTFVTGSVRSDVGVATAVTGNRLEFRIDDVPIGGTGTLTFGAVVARAGADIRNFARGAFLMEGSAGATVSDTTLTRTDGEPAADLRLGKTVDRSTAAPGDTLRYTIRWHNRAAGRAMLSVLYDTLPASVRLVPGSVVASSDVTPVVMGNAIEIPLGNVAPADSGAISLAAVVVAAEGLVENYARAAFLSRNVAATTVSDTARTQVHAAGDLVLSKSVDRVRAAEADTLVYTLSWTNTGLGRATSLVVTDTLDVGLAYVAGTAVLPTDAAVRVQGRVVEFTVPEIAPGASGSIAFRTVVQIEEGLVTNSARAVYTTDGEVRALATDTVATGVEIAHMRLELEALVDRPLHVGDTLTYRIRVTNTHPEVAINNLTVVDSLPRELEFLASEPEELERAPAGNVLDDGEPRGLTIGPGGLGGEVHWRFATLPAQQSLEILLHTRVISIGTGELVNVAAADGAGLRQALAAVATTAAEAAADLRVRKAASVLEAGSGDAVGYTITLENTGSTTLGDVTIHDLPDRGIRLQPGSLTGAVLTELGTTLQLRVGTLAPGAAATVQYVATVEGARGMTLSNGAYATTSSGLETDTVRAIVRVRDAAMLTRVAVGKVWLDDNGDGRQQSAEAPLSHAVIWSSHGETVRADSLGRFTFPDLRGGRYTFRLDPLSLPAGYLDAAPVAVRVDGWTSPVVSFAVRRSPVPVLTRADSISAGFLFGGEAVLRRPRIATPVDGSVIGTNKTFVRVEGAPGGQVQLLRDGEVIAEAVLRPDGSGDFVGVDLTPGPNLFTAVVRTAGAEDRVESRVHMSGAPRSVVRADSAALRAGKGQVLALRVQDAWQRPVAQKPYATVSVNGMTLLDGDVDASSMGVQVPVLESGLLLLRVRGDSAGGARVNVSFGRELRTLELAVLPEIRSLVLLADGEIGAGASARAYGAAVARGALDDRTSVTLSYDSRRTREHGFGGAFDPLGESRYAVLGDASTRMVLGSATTPLALRVERDQSWLHVGDVNTRAFGDANSPAAYARALPGVSTLWKRGALEVSGFGSSVSQQLVQQQFRGDGSSGPYQVGGAVRLGTDRVAVETRDRRNASIVLLRQELERFIDYDIDATTGAILLRRPLRSSDAAGNPQFLTVLAERLEGESSIVGGAHAQYTSTPFGARDSLSVGAGYIEDQSALGGHRLLSGELGAATLLGSARLEIARAEAGDSAGTAFRAGLAVGSLEGTGATLEWLRVGDGFANPANPRLVAGTEDMRLSARGELGSGFSVLGGHARQWFRSQGAERNTTSLGVAQARGERTYQLDVALLAEALNRDTARTELTSLTAKLSRTMEHNNVWLETAQALRNVGGPERPTTYGIGASADVGHGIRAEAAQRVVKAGATWSGLTTMGLRSELATGTRAWTEYQLGHSVDGQQSAALVGIGQKLRIGSTLSVDAQYEQRKGLSDLPVTDVARALPFTQIEPDRWATSLGVEWRPSNTFRSALRGELNDGESTGRGYRIFGSAEAELSKSWTLLARHDARETRRQLNTGEDRTRALQSIAAVAFRPAQRSDWTGLLKVELRSDENPLRNGGAVLNGTDDRVIGAAEAMWTPRKGSELGLRLALRHAQQSGVLAGGSDIVANSQYAGVRARQQVSDRFDLRGAARVLVEGRSDLVRWDAAPALGLRLIEGLELETGYRFGDLRDVDFAQAGGSGFYATLGMSLTEQAGRDLAEFWRQRLGGER